MARGHAQKFWRTAILAAWLVLPVGCQTSRAVDYIPPPEMTVDTGIAFSGIVSDLRGALLPVEQRTGTTLKIAVIRYTTPSGSSRTFGRYLAQKIGEGLSGTPGVELIDPGQVYDALQFLGIEQGILDTKAILAIGEHVGADALILGTYTDLGEKIDIQSKLVALPAGKQLGLFSRTISKTSEVLNLIKVGP